MCCHECCLQHNLSWGEGIWAGHELSTSVSRAVPEPRGKFAAVQRVNNISWREYMRSYSSEKLLLICTYMKLQMFWLLASNWMGVFKKWRRIIEKRHVAVKQIAVCLWKEGECGLFSVQLQPSGFPPFPLFLYDCNFWETHPCLFSAYTHCCGIQLHFDDPSVSFPWLWCCSSGSNSHHSAQSQSHS